MVLSFAAAIVIVAMMVSTTQITNIAYADRDEKQKRWVGEGAASASACTKDESQFGCKAFKDTFGDSLNKFTKNQCESNSADGKCKQVK